MDYKPLTRQQIFDNALNGIRGQNYARAYTDGACAYRVFGDDGQILKCGIGHSIPDEAYQPWMERSVNILVYSVHRMDDFDGANLPSADVIRALFPRTDENEIQFLSDVQGAHDSYLHGGNVLVCWNEIFGSIERFEARMAELAAQYGLIYTPPPGK